MAFNGIHRFQEIPDKPATAKSKAKDNTKPQMTTGTGVWPPSVGIHRVVWNCGNGLSGAPLLGSATASGICRVDWLVGRWMKGKIPYGGIVSIRGEDADGNVGGSDQEEDELEEED